jgi:hypothetical protein
MFELGVFEMATTAYRRSNPCWQTMATIEVNRECGDLDDILEDISFDSRLERVASDDGKLRFELVVNASRGPARSAMAACSLLSALQAIAEDGGLPGFVVVDGAHWLDDATSPQDYLRGDVANDCGAVER